MSREQAERLAELMQEGRATRPAGVVTAALLVDGDLVRLVAIWKDRETLEAAHPPVCLAAVREQRRHAPDPRLLGCPADLA